jgi:hypothetical protein
MRLLLIAPRIESRSQVKNFSGVWAWYLPRELERRGVKVSFDAPLHDLGMTRRQMIEHYEQLDLSGVDHILALGTRYFDRVPKACGRVLMERCSGVVAQVHDNDRDSPCHATFTLRSGGSKRRPSGKSFYVGWAADQELLIPRQAKGELRILVDHPDYGVGRVDRTADMVSQCARFAGSRAWASRYSSVRLRRLVDGGVEDFGRGDATETYMREAAPFEEICLEYGATRVFVVTHPESVGLSVLETAMCGALTVAPEGFIQPDRLDLVRHVEFSDRVPWEEVLDNINVKLSRQMAIVNTWGRVAARVLIGLKQFRSGR